MDTSALEFLARQIRYDILRITHRAGSGHPTSSFSAVELATVLFFKHLRFDTDHPDHSGNDRFILSKGHCSALFYSLYAAAGKISEKELLTYRDFDSPLEGHPTFRFPFTEMAGGSLGQGLSIGAGMAWAGVPHVFVLLGDGELAEGSNWEAVSWASFHNLDNLVAIVDVNRLGQAQETMYEHNTDVYRGRFEAFGWATIVIDGHDLNQIDVALEKARHHRGAPSVVIAKTIKGKGIPYWEDKTGWHNKMLPEGELANALAAFKPKEKIVGVIQKPDSLSLREVRQLADDEAISGNIQTTYNGLVPTKKAFGNAIQRLGEMYQNLIVLDGDVSNSTHTDQFAKAYPDRFLQMYIAEQNMAGVAIGLAVQGLIPCISTFAAFLSRAHDQFRMMPLSGVTVYVNGCYVGVSMGKDGPSQMGLEDLSLFRSIFGSTVLYPSDPYQTEKLVEEMLKIKGVVYIRTTREPTPVIYSADDAFPIGGSKVFQSPSPNHELLTIVAAGITVHEALKAQKELEKEGIGVRVIDCYSVKPIDRDTLKKAALDSKAIIVVEDHYPQGGLGDAVRAALSGTPVPTSHLAVTKLPMSGTAEELLKYEEIDCEAMVQKVKQLMLSRHL